MSGRLISIFLAAMTFAASAAAVTVTDAPVVLNWVPADSTVPAAFFQDVTDANPVTSFYDDSVPHVFDVCLNPGNPADCYPAFAGVSETDVGFSVVLSGQTIKSNAYGGMAILAVAPDGKFLYDATNPSQGALGKTEDLVAITTAAEGSIFVGPGNRWKIDAVNIFAPLPVDSLGDPFGTSLAGLDLYRLGLSREMVLEITDTTDDQSYVATAVPEATITLMLCSGLIGLGIIGRRRLRRC